MGITLGTDGALTAQIPEGITSKPRASHTFLDGETIGHAWHIEIERILTGTELDESEQEAADNEVLHISKLGEEHADRLLEATVTTEMVCNVCFSTCCTCCRVEPRES